MSEQERIEDGNRFCAKCGEFLGMICDPFGRRECGSKCFESESPSSQQSGGER